MLHSSEEIKDFEPSQGAEIAMIISHTAEEKKKRDKKKKVKKAKVKLQFLGHIYGYSDHT